MEFLEESENRSVHELGPRDSIAYPGHAKHRHRLAQTRPWC